MPTAHLISGLPCSGKTTYSVRLRAELCCAMFSLDRWLITVFGRYSIAAVGHEEHTRRVLACRELIWSSATELLRRSVDVIFDDGFFFREHRMRHAALASALGACAKVHFLDTPFDLVSARLAQRNASLPPYNFSVSPEMLRRFHGLFEIPSDGEGAEVVVVRDVMRSGDTSVDVR